MNSEKINGRTPEEIKRGLRWIAHDCDDSGEYCSECECVEECHKLVEDDVARDALALIEHLETRQPKWISVKERLPVKQFGVIVRTGHNLVTTGWRSYHVDVKGGELWEVDGAHNYRNDVTHWMPLPEPPEED